MLYGGHMPSFERLINHVKRIQNFIHRVLQTEGYSNSNPRMRRGRLKLPWPGKYTNRTGPSTPLGHTIRLRYIRANKKGKSEGAQVAGLKVVKLTIKGDLKYCLRGIKHLSTGSFQELASWSDLFFKLKRNRWARSPRNTRAHVKKLYRHKAVNII